MKMELALFFATLVTTVRSNQHPIPKVIFSVPSLDFWILWLQIAILIVATLLRLRLNKPGGKVPDWIKVSLFYLSMIPSAYHFIRLCKTTMMLVMGESIERIMLMPSAVGGYALMMYQLKELYSSVPLRSDSSPSSTTTEPSTKGD